MIDGDYYIASNRDAARMTYLDLQALGYDTCKHSGESAHMGIMLGAVHNAARETIRKVGALSNGSLEREAHELVSQVLPSTIEIDDSAGYAKFKASELGLDQAISRLASLSDTWRTDPKRGGTSKGGAIGYSQRDYSDEEVYSCCAKDKVVKTVGIRGSGYIVDTARCLHYGSRGNLLERLVLMICYSRANCVDKGSGCEFLDPVRQELISKRYSHDRARSFSLRVN